MLKDEYIRVQLHLSDNGHAWTTGYNVRFYESHSSYGCDTYMSIENDDPGSYSPYVDIRYDQSYDPAMNDTQHIRYVINYMLGNMFKGGRVEVNSIKAYIKVDLEEDNNEDDHSNS